jgi:hypothetical protein
LVPIRKKENREERIKRHEKRIDENNNHKLTGIWGNGFVISSGLSGCSFSGSSKNIKAKDIIRLVKGM